MFFIILFNPSNIFAVQNIFLKSNVTNVKKGEEFEISINVNNISIAALQLELHFDENKVELISVPENSNHINNIVLYTWFDETGGSNPKNNSEIVKFKFKAKEAGEAIFGANGTFFDKDGHEIVSTLNGTSIYILEENVKTSIDEQNNINVSDNNNYLQIMRLGIEGISPDFNKDITEYYLIVNPSVSNLDITAIPENLEATVNISGNAGLKDGLNKVAIEVISKDKSKKRIYTINVTRTSEPERANTNLETLSIEYFKLEPEFSSNITHYKTKVTNDIKRVNIFAVPENYLASVHIKDIEELQLQNNIIIVTVTAENGITTKDYIINIYRNTIEEDEKDLKEQEENEKKLATIISEQQAKKMSSPGEQRNNKYKKILPVIIYFVIIASLIAYLIITKKI